MIHRSCTKQKKRSCDHFVVTWPKKVKVVTHSFLPKNQVTDFHESGQVWTLGGPVYIEIVLVDLDLFFKVIDLFLCRNSENKYCHNLLFLYQFWPKFTEMGYYTTSSLWPNGSRMGSDMGPLSSQGSSWYRAIVSLGLSLTIFVLLWLVMVGQTDRIDITKGGTRTKPRNWSISQTGQGPLFTVMIPVTLCHFSRPYLVGTSSLSWRKCILQKESSSLQTRDIRVSILH